MKGLPVRVNFVNLASTFVSYSRSFVSCNAQWQSTGIGVGDVMYDCC